MEFATWTVPSIRLASLYSPITVWPGVASIIAPPPPTDRDGTAFAASKQSVLAGIWGQASDALDPDNPASAPSFSGAWAGAMIQGGDSSARLFRAEFARSRWSPLRKVTKWTGDQWASTYLALFNWAITFDCRYGDKHAIVSNATANPILFASSLYDGATSLRSAKREERRIPRVRNTHRKR